jgi:hypothetical protein
MKMLLLLLLLMMNPTLPEDGGIPSSGPGRGNPWPEHFLPKEAKLLRYAKMDIKPRESLHAWVLVFFREKNENDVYRSLWVASEWNKEWVLIYRNDTLVPPHEQPHCDEPLDELRFNEQQLSLSLNYFCSMGSWTTGNDQYIFGWKNKQFRLLRCESFFINRGTHQREKKVKEY